MELSQLSDTEKIELLEIVREKYPWAVKKGNLKRLAQVEHQRKQNNKK